MVTKSIRGGIYNAIHWYAKANNIYIYIYIYVYIYIYIYMKYHNKNKESSYLNY